MGPIWLKEALFAGQTANGFKLGTALALGWFWARVGGCRIVYRGVSMETVNFDEVLTIVEPDANESATADEITLPVWLSHEPGRRYFYVVRCANRCGQIERTLGSAVEVEIDSGGNLRIGRPNSVFGLTAVRRREGKLEIVWTYCPIEQESGPREIRAYSDGRTGEIGYQNPIAKVAYKGRKFYRYQSERLENGRYLFAIRVADAAGNERESMQRVAIEVREESPEAIEVVSVSGT
jgi:hypothetical protein